MAIPKLFALLFVIAGMQAVSARKKADLSGKRTISWSPPAVVLFENVSRPTIAAELIQRLRVASTPIVLEETKLKDVQKRFGGDIGKEGDASEALAWLCIQGGDTDGRWVLWLTSSEVAGPTIDGFQLRRLPSDERADARCHLLAQPAEIDIPRGLHLGMAEGEVKRRLGEPTATRQDVLYYLHQASVTVRNEPFAEDDSVEILVRKGDVWGIEAEKDTTN